ncbi:MAG: hypothetical protein MUF87_20565 [Anaerolineae bacterium]|jgi:hypothetical protein|nr:hypothetical protein [Anaerolineae bacterium]
MSRYTPGNLEVKLAVGDIITHPFFRQNERTDRALVILPGRGYLSEHPVLYYLRKMAAEQGYDVLSVQYQFQRFPNTPTGDLSLETTQAVDALLAERAYQRVVFAGKSLGTPLAVEQIHRLTIPDRRLILLTPIGEAVKMVNGHRALTILGTADEVYHTLALDAIHAREKPTHTWRFLQSLNHALETEHWEISLAALGEIIQMCEQFLRE